MNKKKLEKESTIMLDDIIEIQKFAKLSKFKELAQLDTNFKSRYIIDMVDNIFGEELYTE